jgi:UDP-N-acetyl-D-galactosamine dehydrogenase
MGLAFKENCPDLRNTRVIDLIRALKEYYVVVDVHDPWVRPQDAEAEYGLELTARPQAGRYDAIVLAAAHDQFREMGVDGIRALGKDRCVLYDVKNILPADQVDGRL